MSQSKILCFHPPDLLKWIPHPYNWVFYRQITHLSPDDAVYLVPRGYQQDNSNLQGLFTPQFMLDHEMRVPNGFDIGNCTVETYDHGYQFNPFAASLNQVAANQIAGQADPVLDQAIRPGFEKLVNDHDISAIWTWVNTVAIEKLAAEHGLPVIHCEWAAFRPPNYRSLAFFDFSGVNGNTDARRMAHEFRDTGGFGALPNHDLADLHRLFMPDATKAP